MNIKIPYYVEHIIDRLISNGHKAYIVGGCVRDSIIGRMPNDWDITTNCTPENIMEIFKDKDVIPTGLKHGTVTILIDSIPIEVTTFRVDGKYSDSRHPDEIKYTNSIVEDLSRRDFTFNAIAYNHQEGLIDPFFGLGDIYSKTIRCVGNPNERFQEDALRMLRAVRFSAQLGFEIDKYTSYVIHDNYKLISNISVERISQEVNKILLSNPLQIFTVNYYNLLNHVIPELDVCFWTNQDNPYHCYSVGKHLIYSAKEIENNLHLRLTMLLHDIAKPQCKTIDENGRGHFYGHAEKSSEMAVEILRRMKYDNYTIMKVRDLIFYHDAEIQDNKNLVRRWLNRVGENTFRDLLKVREADIQAQHIKYYKERHDKLERIKIILDNVIRDKDCFSKKDLAINGTDLIKLGYPEGRKIGVVIDQLVEMVIDNPELNTKEKLLDITKTI